MNIHIVPLHKLTWKHSAHAQQQPKQNKLIRSLHAGTQQAQQKLAARETKEGEQTAKSLSVSASH